MSELVTKTDLTTAIDNAVLRLTLRIGGMVAASVTLLSVIDRLLRP
ncbi:MULTISPECIES: hypothetical protein [unclassified Bradyrhizobium]|nr:MULTISPECIES: hypothetical protein [unclassified Bradyrhizobium]